MAFVKSRKHPITRLWQPALGGTATAALLTGLVLAMRP